MRILVNFFLRMLEVNLTRRKDSEDLLEYIQNQKIEPTGELTFTIKLENLSMDKAQITRGIEKE